MGTLILRGRGRGALYNWVNFRNANLSTAKFRKFREENLYGTGIHSKKTFQVWVYLARLSSFPQLSEIPLPFADRNFLKGIFGQIKKARQVPVA